MSWLTYLDLITKHPELKPKLLRTVGRHQANDWSFEMMQCRSDIPNGTFGYLHKYECDYCDHFFDKPAHHRGPDGGFCCCPECGCGYSENDGRPFKVFNRYTTKFPQRLKDEAAKLKEAS